MFLELDYLFERRVPVRQFEAAVYGDYNQDRGKDSL
jgi:hypothetical protein